MAKPVKHFGKWRIRWKDENDQRLSEVYDTFREADVALKSHQTKVDEIKRGLRAPPPSDRTFSELCDYFLKYRTTLKRRQRDDEGIIRVHLRPFFGHLKIREITAQEIDEFKNQKRHLSLKTVHHFLTLLISLLRVAHELKWISQEPRIKKPRIRLFEMDFHYLRTKEEIHSFLKASLAEGQHIYALYSTAVFTGMRAGELAALQWGDVDLDRRLISVQRSHDGPTKAGEVRYVPILDALLPTLREWKLQSSSTLVFPSEAGTMLRDSSRAFQEVLHRVLERAGFAKTIRGGRTSNYIRFHDLRHTFASHWVLNGGDLFKLQRILGHKTVQMTMRYAHLAPEAFANDYKILGEKEDLLTATIIHLRPISRK